MNDDNAPVTKGDLRLHSEADLEFQQQIYDDLAKRLKDLPTRDDLAKLATTADVQEVVKAYRRFIKATEYVEQGGKWTWRVVWAIASLILAASLLTGAWKVVVEWFGTTAAHGMGRL